MSYSRNIAPLRIDLTVGGKLISTREFTSFEEKAGRLVLPETDVGFEELYHDEWFYRLGLINLVEGRTLVQISAEDYAGRVSLFEMDLEVRAE